MCERERYRVKLRSKKREMQKKRKCPSHQKERDRMISGISLEKMLIAEVIETRALHLSKAQI